MKKRALGSSNIHISEISLGCMSLPTNLAEARPILAAAIDAGINYFDTADLYDKGINEEMVGTLLKPNRQDIILATKVGNRWDDHGDGWSWDPSPSHIKNGVKDSLRRLQTDYIDVYQLHGGTMDDPWDEIIDTFEGLKKDGLIREYGISSIRPNVIKRYLPASSAVNVMMQYSLLDRRPEEWFNTIQANGASVVTRGTVAKGLLTSKWREKIGKGYLSYSDNELQETLSSLEMSFEDIHALALAFNLRNATVASTVIGARNVEQLQENIAAYERMDSVGELTGALDLTKAELYMEHRE